MLELLPIFKGLLSFVLSPELFGFANEAGEGEYWGKGSSAAYCYRVWLKHLALSVEAGMSFPGKVAEIGPGDSLGVGVSALLTGVSTYHAYDVRFVNVPEADKRLVKEIATGLESRSLRPATGWPRFEHLLVDGCVTREIAERLSPGRALAPAQFDAIISSLDVPVDEPGGLRRGFPTTEAMLVDRGWDSEYDFLLSHSVLEYVPDLDNFFALCHGMLRPGGYMSHQVDLSSLGITSDWNAHLAYGNLSWKLVRGRRRFYPNRKLVPDYICAAEAAGFKVVRAVTRTHEAESMEIAEPTGAASQSPDGTTAHGLYFIARKT